jgi:cytochrome b561
MRLWNDQRGYGLVTQGFHWLVAVLFAFQLLSANVMTRMGTEGPALGLVRDQWFNWHKSIGLVALVVAIGRVLARRKGRLPDWAPTLGEGERRFVHRAEQVLYAAMFAMPVSGFLYVMAGGYGVRLFGAWDLPNPVGAVAWLAALARWVHFLAGLALVVTLAGHIGLVLRHQLWLKDGLLRRMLPGWWGRR